MRSLRSYESKWFAQLLIFLRFLHPWQPLLLLLLWLLLLLLPESQGSISFLSGTRSHSKRHTPTRKSIYQAPTNFTNSPWRTLMRIQLKAQSQPHPPSLSKPLILSFLTGGPQHPPPAILSLHLVRWLWPFFSCCFFWLLWLLSSYPSYSVFLKIPEAGRQR